MISSQCGLCVHYLIKKGVICKAFPDGIPLVIFNGEYDHNESYPGDNGIRFEPVEREKQRREEAT